MGGCVHGVIFSMDTYDVSVCEVCSVCVCVCLCVCVFVYA